MWWILKSNGTTVKEKNIEGEKERKKERDKKKYRVMKSYIEI